MAATELPFVLIIQIKILYIFFFVMKAHLFTATLYEAGVTLQLYS